MIPAKFFKKAPWKKNSAYIVLSLGVVFLMLYKLGNLTNGVSPTEVSTNSMALGWHGLYHNPLYLPLNILRSIDFFLFSHHGMTLLRLPNAIFGGLTIVSFWALAYLWHGKKTAFYTTIMFACSAWVLHVSRLASFDVIYLWAITTGLLGYVCLDEFESSKIVRYLNLFFLGLLATIPGLIWLSLVLIYFERDMLKEDFKLASLSARALQVILLIIWLPLVLYRDHVNHTFKEWLGLPNHFPGIFHFIKGFIAVPVHLLIRGPQYPELWLGKAEVLDAFALAMLLIGVYTYAQHRKNTRTKLLAALSVLSVVLIGLEGSVSLSLIIPLAYLFIAMGLGYLVHSWKKVFPKNPVAKWLSVLFIAVAIILSCVYNLRSYFVAWPHNPITYTTFDQTI